MATGTPHLSHVQDGYTQVLRLCGMLQEIYVFIDFILIIRKILVVESLREMYF